VILGAVLACSASLLYNVGQALDAREAPAAESLRPALLLRLVRRPRWLAGTGLNLLGWPLQALAVGLAPLAVVQPSLAFGLLALLAIGSRTPGVRVGRRDVGATLAIFAGVVVVAAVSGVASREPGTGVEPAVVLGALGRSWRSPRAAPSRGAGSRRSSSSTRYTAVAPARRCCGWRRRARPPASGCWPR
jgi:hypothetical protein